MNDDTALKIPITICHGLSPCLDRVRFRNYLEIASELGFSSINYDQLYHWLSGTGSLPKKPIMFDFDHPVLNIKTEINPLMAEFGYKGNWFINSGYHEQLAQNTTASLLQAGVANWDQIGELMAAGWTIGAHTHTHPDLSDLAAHDPDGECIAAEMDKNNALLKKYLGLEAKYFAFTGGEAGLTWSTSAAVEAEKRYRLGRLWIAGSRVKADGKMIRYGDFVGIEGPDERDNGPPNAARYITKNTPFFKIPSMEIEKALIYDFEPFRRYLCRVESE